MIPYNPPLEPWLHILYQDDHIIVVNKPSELLSVPGKAPEHHDSIMSRIQRDFPAAESVHRLDMATSGVMVVALHKRLSVSSNANLGSVSPKNSILLVSGDI